MMGEALAVRMSAVMQQISHGGIGRQELRSHRSKPLEL